MSNITVDTILRDAAKGPNYGLAATIVCGQASDDQLKSAARMIANGVGAAAYLQAAIDNMPARKVAPTTTQRTTRTRRTSTVASAPKELTPFQQRVNADPEAYGVGFGGKRKQRGLPSLTATQRANRKALAVELGLATA